MFSVDEHNIEIDMPSTNNQAIAAPQAQAHICKSKQRHAVRKVSTKKCNDTHHKVAHINVRSVRTRVDELNMTASESRI